ncbi:MAG: hypothetical protein Q9228_005731, partial [Teloschistes exilis]
MRGKTGIVFQKSNNLPPCGSRPRPSIAKNFPISHGPFREYSSQRAAVTKSGRADISTGLSSHVGKVLNGNGVPPAAIPKEQSSSSLVMHRNSLLLTGLFPLLLASVSASPVGEANILERNLPASECAKITKVVSILKVHEATSFCSSFLGIKTKSSIIPATKTTTVTSTTGTPSTTVVFLPGNPPPSKERREADAVESVAMEKRDLPDYLNGVASQAISSACECLNLATPVITSIQTSTKTSTVKVPAATVTKTVYPCATPVPSMIPTVPYGLSNGVGVSSSGNTLYGSGTTGTTLEGCCNLCYFGVPNCTQAFYYFYEGCVIQQADMYNGTGIGVSSVCPKGQIAGLTYNRDANPPFRSTGDIAGPCGQTYNNLTCIASSYVLVVLVAMALDAATAKEMIQKLAEDRANYLDTLSRAHDVLAKALEASVTGKSPPKLTSDAVRQNTNNRSNSIMEVESLKKSSTFSPEDSDTDDNESLFVQDPLPKELHDEEGLRKHLQGYDWTPHDRSIVGTVLNNKQLLERSKLFPVTLGPVDDRSHLSHYSIFDVGRDGAPLEVQKPGQKPVSRAQTIWNNLKGINADESRQREAVGRITIVREPSPLLFAALHYTMHQHFDMDEIFSLLVEDKTKAHAHRPFSTNERQQRTFVFTLDFFTIIGDECQPMSWQLSDQDDSSETHVPLTRCSSVVALSLSGPPARQVKNKARRADRKTGNIFDPFAPWRVLSIQVYPDWKHTIDSHNSTRHYVNGPEAFIVTLRAEFRDAQKRLMEVYNRISDLVKMPPNFMFSRDARDRLLFEDDEFTYSRRYFWAHQSLGIMNEDIQEMVLAYRSVFTDHVWDGSSKIIWPGDESVSSRYATWRKRMKSLREDIEIELRGLENISVMNQKKMEEIKGLRDNLFSGTSVLESRRSVDQAMITVQQGHNIKLLTLVTIFFLPLTFVTSVFGMTNMRPDASFHAFGIVTGVVCLPTYMLIGSLNTTSGIQFWRQKTKQFLAFIGRMFTGLLAVFGCSPHWANRPSHHSQTDIPAIKPLQHRSQSARDGMAARGTMQGPPSSGTFNRRPTLSPLQTLNEGSSQNQLRKVTHTSTVHFEDEKLPQSPLHEDAEGPKHLIKMLDHGSHRKTATWGTHHSNGHAHHSPNHHHHHHHGVATIDHHERSQTFIQGTPMVGSPTSIHRSET